MRVERPLLDYPPTYRERRLFLPQLLGIFSIKRIKAPLFSDKTDFGFELPSSPKRLLLNGFFCEGTPLFAVKPQRQFFFFSPYGFYLIAYLLFWRSHLVESLFHIEYSDGVFFLPHKTPRRNRHLPLMMFFDDGPSGQDFAALFRMKDDPSVPACFSVALPRNFFLQKAVVL